MTTSSDPGLPRPRRGRALIVLVALAAALFVAWLVARPRYYLRRIHEGDAPSQYALVKVGPRAIPLVEREIRGLGPGPAGRYRSDLVRVLVDIRHDVLAERLGSPLLWVVAAAEVGADGALADTVRQALVDEPDREQRGAIVLAMADLDFDTDVAAMCAAFPGLDADGQAQLVMELDHRATVAASRSRDDTSPWKGVPEAQVASRQDSMRGQLACAIAPVVARLEHDAPHWMESSPFWGTQSIHALAALRPLPPDQARRVGALALVVKDPYIRQLLLDGFGADLAGGDRAAMRPYVASLYRALPSRDRLSLVTWAAERGAAVGASPTALFCDVFADPDPDATESGRFALLLMVAKSADPDPCVASAVMATYGGTLSSPRVFVPWRDTALDVLEARAAADPRIAPWAKPMVAAARGPQAARLAKLAGVDVPPPRAKK